LSSSAISLEFNVNRNIDEAATTCATRSPGYAGNCRRGRRPDNLESRLGCGSGHFAFLHSNTHSRLELTELADRLAVQRLQTIPGVASVELRGQPLCDAALGGCDATRGLQPGGHRYRTGAEAADVDLPSGRIESLSANFPSGCAPMDEPIEYENLILATRDGTQVKFSDIGRVELGPADYRSSTYFNGRDAVSVRFCANPRPICSRWPRP